MKILFVLFLLFNLLFPLSTHATQYGPMISCCSNVLFLPGLEASRLYVDSSGILGTSTNRLWEPNRNGDIEKLSLNEFGISKDSTIYTKDILGKALKTKNIYKSFIAMMNSVVAEETINEWLSFPYDWRMSIDDIVYGETNLSASSTNLISVLEELSYSSRTGKVTIIAHSNGGLIAKLLSKALEEKGEGDLIDKIIYVTIPELGTPQAVLAMLHGYKQSILGGSILSENTARTFSQNTPGAYGLLPSKEYFEQNPITIISDHFSSNSNIIVNTYESLKNFLIDNSFSKKTTKDINIPLLLNKYLIDKSESIHESIDSWKSLYTTPSISLIGWGIPTVNSIKYEKDKHCNESKKNTCDIAFIPIMSNDGDGTVLTNSDNKDSDLNLFFNLKEFNEDNKPMFLGEIGNEINHANILESSAILSLLKKQISNSFLSEDYGQYFSEEQPVDNNKWLTIKLYSPVDIHIYDKKGNHTGITKGSDKYQNSIPYENNIPSSYYGDFGRIKMIRVPYDDYQIVLEGNGSGVFSLDAEVSQFNEIIASTTFNELLVTPSLNVDLMISTSTDSFATSTVMNMDYDGDGITEYIQNSDEFIKKNPKYKKEHKKVKKIIKKIFRKIEKQRNNRKD